MNAPLDPHHPKLLNGRALATAVKKSLHERIVRLKKDHKIRPGLAIIRIGNNPSSQVYVTSKKRQCQEIGIRSFEHVLPETTSLETIIDLIHNINDDPEIHGLIVQLPLPAGLNKDVILQAIDPQKDVDGLHPLNLGRLFCAIPEGYTPCTPRGCLHLLKSIHPSLRGLHATIIGTSNLVGKPMAHLLIQEGCSVTLINSKTKNPQDLCADADIVIAAAGVPLLVQESWIKPGATVIDVGINRLVTDEGTPYLVGDVDTQAVLEKVQAITPVPGGVGPLTVAYLLDNTVIAAELKAKAPLSQTP